MFILPKEREDKDFYSFFFSDEILFKRKVIFVCFDGSFCSR